MREIDWFWIVADPVAIGVAAVFIAKTARRGWWGLFCWFWFSALLGVASLISIAIRVWGICR